MLVHMSKYRSIERVRAQSSRTPWFDANIFDLEKEGACVAFLRRVSLYVRQKTLNEPRVRLGFVCV
jgi:hypothetical protein